MASYNICGWNNPRNGKLKKFVWVWKLIKLYRNILLRDVVALYLLLVSSSIFLVGGGIGTYIKEADLGEKINLSLLIAGMYLMLLVLIFIRLYYLKWLLQSPYKTEGVLLKADKRFYVDGIVGCICYSFEYGGKEYLHYGSFFVSRSFRDLVASSDKVTVCFYPKLKLSIVKEIFD